MNEPIIAEAPYGVYIRTDDMNRVIDISSDAFLRDLNGWQKIDEGYGDKYHHAQGNYLDGTIYDMDGIPLYKWDGSQVVKRTEEEIEEERAAIPAPPPSPQEQLRADVDFIAAMTGVML